MERSNSSPQFSSNPYPTPDHIQMYSYVVGPNWHLCVEGVAHHQNNDWTYNNHNCWRKTYMLDGPGPGLGTHHVNMRIVNRHLPILWIIQGCYRTPINLHMVCWLSWCWAGGAAEAIFLVKFIQGPFAVLLHVVIRIWQEARHVLIHDFEEPSSPNHDNACKRTSVIDNASLILIISIIVGQDVHGDSLGLPWTGFDSIRPT